MSRRRGGWLFAMVLACEDGDHPRSSTLATPGSRASASTQPGPEAASPSAPAGSSATPQHGAASQPCNQPQARRCAGHGPSGPEGALLVCASGSWSIAEACGSGGCQAMPDALADRCSVAEVPPELLRLLSPTPYVEDRCEPAEVSGFATAKRCRYQTMGVSAEVIVANPEPAQVARWVVDAAAYAAPLEEIRERDPAAWRRGVLALGRHVRQQSSRIFPLQGEVIEDLGQGPHAFAFDRGVVTPCDKGSCRCRINSLTPGAYCRYLEAMGEDRAACLAKYQGEGTIEAWREACVDNHRRALSAAHNEHFRAKALVVGRALAKRCAARGCKPLELVALLERELGL